MSTLAAGGDDALLPPYQGLSLANIHLVRTPEEAACALAVLSQADVIGFDTESKPTFTKGEVSTGPHLVQLATDHGAWLFQTVTQSSSEHALLVLKPVLESNRILKVGFGLGDDVRRLRAKFGLELANVTDLATALRRRGERNTLGARSAVARVLGQRLQKSKRITTTNWASTRLSPAQLQYAADDAQAALRVYRQWKAGPAATQISTV